MKVPNFAGITQEGFYMARQVRESERTFFSASQKLGKHSRI